MKIVIKTPQEQQEERVKLIAKAVKMLERAEKYNRRLNKSLQWIQYQIQKIDRSMP